MSVRHAVSALVLVFAVAAPAARAQSETGANVRSVAQSCGTRILPPGAQISGRPSDVVLVSRGAGALLLLGVEHSREPTHPQFDEIIGLFERAQPTVALYEGYGQGFASNSFQAISEDGEPGLVRYLAATARISAFSFEPGTSELYAALLETFDAEQIQLFFLLRHVHQAMAFLRMPWEGVQAYTENYIALEFSSAEIAWPIQTFQQLESAFERIWPGKSLRELPPSWFDPRLDSTATQGRFLNAVATAQRQYRDQYIYRALAVFLLSGHRVFALIGKSHVPALAPALACLDER